jgi:hypothetical protein
LACALLLHIKICPAPERHVKIKVMSAQSYQMIYQMTLHTKMAPAMGLGSKTVIKAFDGRDIPVPRAYVPVLKEAGFLP